MRTGRALTISGGGGGLVHSRRNFGGKKIWKRKKEKIWKKKIWRTLPKNWRHPPRKIGDTPPKNGDTPWKIGDTPQKIDKLETPPGTRPPTPPC